MSMYFISVDVLYWFQLKLYNLYNQKVNTRYRKILLNVYLGYFDKKTISVAYLVNLEFFNRTPL